MHVLLPSVPQSCSRPPWPTPLLETPGYSQARLGQSFVGSLILYPGSWCTRFCLCPPRIYFPVLGKFWQLYGGVNGDLLQEGLCHTQVCCTQSPCTNGSPLLTCTSIGDAEAQFCLSLCGVPGSWCAQGLCELSEPLWQEWGLILNANFPLYHFSEASPLPLDIGYLLSAGHRSSAMQLLLVAPSSQKWNHPAQLTEAKHTTFHGCHIHPLQWHTLCGLCFWNEQIYFLAIAVSLIEFFCNEASRT